MSYKGVFKPKNPGKYKGDPSNIIYRSLWELKFMMYLDAHNSVISWASEEIIIPYISPLDGRPHRYFPDFYVKKVNSDGAVEVAIIEIKPYAQSVEPIVEEKRTRRYVKKVATYAINQAKWKAAREYCEDRKWKFMVLTEKELGIK